MPDETAANGMPEDVLVDWLRRRFVSRDPAVLAGCGPDDCAHLRVRRGSLAVTTDAFVEGSHFLSDTPPRLVAAKAVRASLSDLAASGCRARWLLASVCFRRGLGGAWAREFADALAENAERYGASIIGGDTISGSGGTFVSVTAIGEPMPGGPVTRSGARPGDALVVTGSLGGSLCGRHLVPEPRFAEMAILLAPPSGRGEGGAGVTAAMDISDGFALDLSRLCRESGVGAVVESESVPVSEAALAGEDGKTPLAHALGDGEDFEILAAVDPAAWCAFSDWFSANPRDPRIKGLASFTRVGWITSGLDLAIKDAGGGIHPLAADGYGHQW